MSDPLSGRRGRRFPLTLVSDSALGLFRRLTPRSTPPELVPDPVPTPQSDALNAPHAEPDGVFCVHPWIHLRLQDDAAHVCCRYRDPITQDGAPLSLCDHSLDDLWNSDEMRRIRREMVEGRPVPGCAECYAEDQSGGFSMRRRDNGAWQNGWLNENHLSIAALKAQAVQDDFRVSTLPANIEIDTGSLCNLKCRMCHDGVSSRIATDLVHRSWAHDQVHGPYHNPELPVRPARVRRWSMAESLESAMTAAPGQVKRLYFLGGEPLLVKEVGDLLQRLVDGGVSGDITLALVSNGTITSSWLDVTQHFKSLDLTISIDGFSQYYEYIRYPAKWEKLTRNLDAFKRLPKTALGAAVTVQLYNALNICDLFRYLDEMNIGFYAWPVHVPRYLSIEALPPNARRVAADRLAAYADGDCRPAHRDTIRGLVELMRPTSDTFDARLLRDSMLFTNDLDASRGQNFAQVHGELWQLFAEAGVPWTSETVHVSQTAGCA
jgi:MoaA/NifB/PqqE/SkfB family radical SAM enzyme